MSTTSGLPRLLLIADGFVSGRRGMDAASVRDRAVRLVEAGVPWVSLRDHVATPEAFSQTADGFARDLRRANSDLRLSVHGRLGDAHRLGAGLHVGRWGATRTDAVAAGLSGPVGFSAHGLADAVSASEAGADYVTLSPIFPTTTHPEAVPLGISALRRVVDAVGAPVFALGGLTPARAREGRLGGAYGAAVLSALLDAPDVGVVADFLTALA